jgi:Flp pilus assembly protein TadD
LALQAGRDRQPGAGDLLAAMVADADQPAIARASAVLLLPDNLERSALAAYQTALADPDPHVRMAVLRALAPFSPEQRLAVAGDLLADPLRAVRIEAASALAAVPRGALSPERRQQFDRALAELVDAHLSQAERPESHLNLGVLYTQQGRLAEAEAAYDEALRLTPSFMPATINLADLQGIQGRNDEAEATLRQAIAGDSEAAAAHHALGLLLVRRDKPEAALDALALAARLEPDNVRYGYVHGVALNSLGQADRAIEVLEDIHDRHPSDRDTLIALITMLRDRGALEQARRYARDFATAHPSDRTALQLLNELGAE